MDRVSIQLLLARAKQDELYEVKGKLAKEVEELEASIKLEKSKLEALDVTLNQRTEDLYILQAEISDLEALKARMSATEYQDAKNSLLELMNTSQAAISKLQDERICLYANVQEYRTKVSSLQSKLNHDDAMATRTNTNVHGLHVSEAVLEECRPEIQQTYHLIQGYHEMLKKEHEFAADLRGLHLEFQIRCCYLRRLQEQSRPLNAAEETILRRAFGVLSKWLTLFTPMGHIPALDQKSSRQWGDEIRRLNRELAAHQALERKLAGNAQPKLVGYQSKSEAKEPEPPVLEEADPIAELLRAHGVIKALQGKNVVVFGGISNRPNGQRLTQWFEKTFDLRMGKTLTWYEAEIGHKSEAEKCIDSIRNGGVDFVVFLTCWMSHQAYGLVEKAAEGCNIPYALCGTGSETEIARAIAKAVGVMDLHEPVATK